MKSIDILERDNWTCGLCGIATPKELRGTTHPHAPEVDHIIPKTQHGGEEPENLRCACRSCNQQKLSYLDGELHLENFKMVPAPEDLVAVMAATEAMRQGHLRGGRRTHEIYPELAIAAGCKAGLIGGCATNATTNGRKGNGGRIGGHQGGLIGGPIGRHNRWHLNRGRISSSCELCKVGVKDFWAFLELEQVLRGDTCSQ